MTTDPGMMNNAGGAGKGGAARRTNIVQILLIGSLAFNMFFLGAGAVLLGRAFFHPNARYLVFHNEPRHLREFPGPGLIFRALPPEARHRIEGEVADRRRAMREAMHVARQTRREALEAFSAERYSAKALEESLKAARAADLAAVNAAYDLIGPVALDLTPEERRLVVQAVRDRRPPPWRPRGSEPDGGPPASEGSLPPNDR